MAAKHLLNFIDLYSRSRSCPSYFHHKYIVSMYQAIVISLLFFFFVSIVVFMKPTAHCSHLKTLALNPALGFLFLESFLESSEFFLQPFIFFPSNLRSFVRNLPFHCFPQTFSLFLKPPFPLPSHFSSLPSPTSRPCGGLLSYHNPSVATWLVRAKVEFPSVLPARTNSRYGPAESHQEG